MLSSDARNELINLTVPQRRLVLRGLYEKRRHHDKTGQVSFSYDHCPVCRSVGSTEAEPRCDECYIPVSCQAPFREGFRDDPQRSAEYFEHMLTFLRRCGPGTVVVGGNWGEFRRPSKIAQGIADEFGADLFNGGPADALQYLDVSDYGLIFWLPNVPNEEPKHYPHKGLGATMVVSKVMREGITQADAAKRIFAMGGNAVVEIYPVDRVVGDRMVFRLADALNHQWYRGNDVSGLAVAARKLHKWSRHQIRVRTFPALVGAPSVPEMAELLQLVQKLSRQVENQLGQRYFGNVSTRCVKLFPSARLAGSLAVQAWVSPRNVDKRFIEPNDMVAVQQERSGKAVEYEGSRKPSVDAAVQLELYRHHPTLRFMIHGHAYIAEAPYTEHYYPCGDLRELLEVSELLSKGHRCINLKSHGFLIAAAGMEELRDLATAKFINRL